MASGLLSTLKKMISSSPKEESAQSREADGICSPAAGRVIRLSEVPDEVFSGGVLGKGAAVIPEDGRIYAPADAIVASIAPSRHAIGLRTESGIEILLHVGIDTVELDGRPFACHVREGDRVKKGDLLLTADLAMITEQGYRTDTPVLVTNSDEYESVDIVKTGSVAAGALIMTVG